MLASTSKLTVNPVTVLSILDHFSRRSNASDKRVIGTLLGVVVSNKLTEITGCFAVPYVEREGGVAIGKDVHKQLRALHQKSSPSEVVVGWFSCTTKTTQTIDPWTVLIQDFYATECRDPIHLTVAIDSSKISVRAFRCIALTIDSEPLAAEFRPLPLSTIASEPERIGLGAMMQNTSPQNVEASAEKLLSMLETVSQYAEDVADGKVTPDHEVGKKLCEILAAVPSISHKDFSVSFSNSLQDLLMVVYLASLTRAQLQVAEKLGSVM